MSALARLLRARGLPVSGCSDRITELTERLTLEGIPVDIGHSADHLSDAGTVVVSSAIASDNPELVEAQRRGLHVVRRGSLLATLMSGASGIAVAGTHGKTTTTAMLGTILERAGFDPTVVVGGEIPSGSNARNGNGEWFVAESDESDGSFLELRPRIAVVTNVENDHVTCDAGLRELIASFERFMDCIGSDGTVAIGVDEPRAAQLAMRRKNGAMTFGFAPNSNVRATAVCYDGFGSTFDVLVDGARAGAIALRVPGAINVQNALGALCAALAAGVPFAAAAEALAQFRGVRRRFEVLARSQRMTVVDDYAHHPTAVEATIAAARAGWDGDIVVAFQPHRFTRTQYLAREFALSLRGADHVVLTPIYAASESPLPGVDATSIGEPLRGMGTEVSYVDAVDDVPDALLSLSASGALALLLGAGTITSAAHDLAERVTAVPVERIAP